LKEEGAFGGENRACEGFEVLCRVGAFAVCAHVVALRGRYSGPAFEAIHSEFSVEVGRAEGLLENDFCGGVVLNDFVGFAFNCFRVGHAD